MYRYDWNFKADASESGTFEGYASVFGNVDAGGDIVLPGAFVDSLVSRRRKGLGNIPLLWQHDMHEPVGVISDAAEDSKGLHIKGELLVDDDPAAKRAYAHMKKGTLGGLSIGYRVAPGGAETDATRPGVRLLKKVDLIEVSCVTVPMNERARITGIKHLIGAGELPTLSEFEGFLREAGFSKTQAAAVASKGLSHLRGEPGVKNPFIHKLAAALHA